MEVANYIKPELMVLVPVLWLIGVTIKNSQLSDNLIPVILGGCGIILAVLYTVANTAINSYHDLALALFVGITQGVLAAGLSVYTNQLIKQSKK